ncbi:FliG C-terminal domain-containing protein [Parvularcula oceani]|uniref:FliG C-terminal domain-containing protein n=1 Tax=Parvularcula oceani TaxID=1247963 RepID=UPI00055B0608|nr:FliG C-terminal domain-containing protein [Parvularcula oceani]
MSALPSLKDTDTAAPATAAPPAQAEQAAPLPPRPPAERAAVVLALLGEERLEHLKGHLPLHRRDEIEAALSRLSGLDAREQQAIVRNFAENLAQHRAGLAGGQRNAQKVTDVLFGPKVEPIQCFVPELPPANTWDRVAELKAADVALFLEDKPAPIIATALGSLPEAFAAEVAIAISETASTASIVRLATRGEIKPVAAKAVEAMFEQAFFSTNRPPGSGVDEELVAKIAALLNRLTTARREAAFEALNRELDSETLAAIKRKVLGFNDLGRRLPRSAVPLLFREADEKTLLLAISYALREGAPVAEYLFGNISQRLVGQLKDTMEGYGVVSEEVGEKAQADIVAFVFDSVEEGRFQLLDPDEAEDEGA